MPAQGPPIASVDRAIKRLAQNRRAWRTTTKQRQAIGLLAVRRGLPDLAAWPMLGSRGKPAMAVQDALSAKTALQPGAHELARDAAPRT